MARQGKARQMLFSEKKFFKAQASKRVKNILGRVVDKRSEDKNNEEEVMIPRGSDKEKYRDDCMNANKQLTCRLSEKNNHPTYILYNVSGGLIFS